MEGRTFGHDEMIVCLSKNLSDPYINKFAQGAGLPIRDYNYDITKNPVLIRSLAKRKLIHRLLKEHKTFYYMDSGYVGNYKGPQNPLGYKYWHRIVKNGLQHNEIIERPDDRWKKLNQEIQPRKNGTHVLLVAPSEKPCKFYGIDLQEWIDKTVNVIKKYTDRPIIIRQKNNRPTRIENPIFDQLKDCHALVTYQSIAAVESVLYGIPAFTLAPTAADPVCDKDLSLIENPTEQDRDKIHKWAHHLAYGQFHIEEFKNGDAYKILTKEST